MKNALDQRHKDRVSRIICEYGLSKVKKRFYSKIIKIDDNCIDYKSNKSTQGYSTQSFRINNKTQSCFAHRLSWFFSGRLFTEGLVLDHICRNRFCINVDHLREVTRAENTLCGFGAAAINKRKTHCKRGHELSGWNAMKHSKRPGTKHCRTCHYDLLDRKKERLKNGC